MAATTANPRAGFSELIRLAKSGESEAVWDALLDRVLGELQTHAKQLETRHGTAAEALVTETWLEVSRRIDTFAIAKDDAATFDAFSRWMRGIQERLAGVMRQRVRVASPDPTRQPVPRDENQADTSGTSNRGSGRWAIWVLAAVLLLLVLNIVLIVWFGW